MQLGSESDLHPLMATARQRPGEDCVDSGADALRPHLPTVDRDALRTFGQPGVDTQGPAGSRVPDLDERPRPAPAWGGEGGPEEPAWRYAGDPDAPPDAVGPRAPLDADMPNAVLEGGDPAGDEAAAAVLAARRRYGGARPPSGTMLDVLEEAEADYGRRASGLDAGAAAAAAAEVAPPDTPRKAAICEATRERIIQALFQALQANPRRVGYGQEPSRDAMSHAQEVEDALFARCHTKQVYLSAVANAVRLARSEPSWADIPRIAAGEPRELAQGHTAGEASPYVTGLLPLKADY